MFMTTTIWVLLESTAIYSVLSQFQPKSCCRFDQLVFEIEPRIVKKYLVLCFFCAEKEEGSRSMLGVIPEILAGPEWKSTGSYFVLPKKSLSHSKDIFCFVFSVTGHLERLDV
jgi:hypothetical protein